MSAKKHLQVITAPRPVRGHNNSSETEETERALQLFWVKPSSEQHCIQSQTHALVQIYSCTGTNVCVLMVSTWTWLTVMYEHMWVCATRTLALTKLVNAGCEVGSLLKSNHQNLVKLKKTNAVCVCVWACICFWWMAASVRSFSQRVRRGVVRSFVFSVRLR